MAGLAYLLVYTGWQGGSVTAELSALFNGEPSPIMEQARQRREESAQAAALIAGEDRSPRSSWLAPGEPTPSTTTGAPSTSASGLGPIRLSSEMIKVNVGSGTILLEPGAAIGYHKWSEKFGQLIPCTTGWRDAARQDAAYADDPTRFAPASGSAHTRGLAVDVDNNWLSALPAGTQTKLRLAAKATGWRQARWMGEANCGTNPDNDNEPWHFSYKVCA